MPHELLHATLNSDAGPDDTADQVVTLALDGGGPDNITAIVVDVAGSSI